jgi:hypothetical protein
MSDQPPLFTSVPEKRRVTPALIGIVALSVALLGIVIGIVIWAQHQGPKYHEGRTQFAGVRHPGDPQYDEYLPYIKIINAAGMVSENMIGEQQAVVVGYVANKGNHVVDVLEIRAVLYNADNQRVREFEKTPIQPDFPLLPMEMRKFSVWVEPFPPEWLTGHIDVEIHGYRLKK